MTSACLSTVRSLRSVALLLATACLLLGVLWLLIGTPSPLLAQTECSASPSDDVLKPDGWFLYFADEFNCELLPAHWQVQGSMGAVSYQPPRNGYVHVNSGALQVGVVGKDVAFPYLYLVDDSATLYDVGFTDQRIDWIPNSGDYRLAVRLRFRFESLGDHRVSLYADGHRPSYAGPLYYVGADYNSAYPDWRGIIVGADRGNRYVDLDTLGYADVYADWIVVTVDQRTAEDSFVIAVDGVPVLESKLSDFKDYPSAATRPDVLYLGSLAYLEHATGWIDIDIDWLRVYAPSSTAPAWQGIVPALAEAWPGAVDAPTDYSRQLPSGPFAHTPYWAENFDAPEQAMPSYWRLLIDNDPANTDTLIEDGHATLRNNGQARAVPVWGIYDDLRLHVQPPNTAQTRYLAQRAHNKPAPAAITNDPPTYIDWRPDRGNIRYAWKARQSAEGYGVEVSNGGHVPYFTGAMFYTLLDTTTPGGGQFIFPTCQEKYFWRLHRLPAYAHLGNMETVVMADYINGTAYFYIDGQLIGWWPESDCSLNWYLQGENATSPDLLFFGNPAEDSPGRWSEVAVDWFATFPGLPTAPAVEAWLPQHSQIEFNWNSIAGLANYQQLTATLTFSAAEALHWQVRPLDHIDWLSVTPLSGTLSTESTTPGAPLTAHLSLTVTRPLTYSIQSALLTLDAQTNTGSRVTPISAAVRAVFTSTGPIHHRYLPQISGFVP